MPNLKAISIDGDLDAQTQLRRIADSIGIEIVSFENFADALEYLDENDVDIIFIDFMMQVIDGLDMIQNIRMYHPNALMFIMVSVISDKELVEELFFFQHIGILVKPLSLEASSEKILKFISMEC